MSEEKLKFTVNREEWLRGQNYGCLLDEDGMKCCLGFAALALGYSQDKIRDIGRPEELVDELLSQQ